MLDIEFCNKIESEGIPVYFTDEYQRIFADYDGSYPNILKVSKDSGTLYLPILIHPVADFFEAYSAYGYGGFWSESETVLSEDDLEQIKEFLRSQRVIDLFIRNSPFLENQRVIPEKYSLLNRITYMVSLSHEESFELFKARVNQKIRWAVNYAQRNGLLVEKRTYDEVRQEEIDAFYDIYLQTMKSRNAEDYYYFSKEFFLNHFETLKDNCDLYLVKKDDEVIAGSLFLKDTRFVHYHFSAANIDYYKLQPMDLMLLRAIFDYGNEGKQFMHLGGGLSADATDGLSRFKKKFSDAEKLFYISKIVVDEQNYINLRGAYGVQQSRLFLINDSVREKKE